ncbi:MAG: hypothetical protein SGI77_28380 [Pirellulaceae bacterium]|nr:hypothetical protein [Pirellulaceae bacterium]
MTKLWRTIEESPLLMDVKDVWRERLGMEFEPLSHFLEATNIVATRLPGRNPWTSYKVVSNDEGFAAFCESTGESREVPRADVICHQLNSRQLAAELNAALSLGRKPEWLDNSRRVWFLGNLSLELQSRPVYMSLHIASDMINDALHAAAAHARSTFLLLDLNSRRRDQRFDASARIVDCKPVEIEQLISVTADGRLLAKSKSRELIASILGVTLESRLSGYVFQCKGKHRMLAFNSEIEITSETNGNWYIEQLLAKPNVAFRCTHLESLLAGLAEETSTGSIGEVVDMETLKGYRDRLQEIDEELEEAASFNDPARQEKLGDERQAILDQMKSAQGIGGRVRQKFDAERSRKTVCKAISRSIEAIEKVHPELGLHLHKSINLGLEVSYNPDVVIDWLF